MMDPVKFPKKRDGMHHPVHDIENEFCEDKDQKELTHQGQGLGKSPDLRDRNPFCRFHQKPSKNG